jgi:hypothetical protein
LAQNRLPQRTTHQWMIIRYQDQQFRFGHYIPP